MPSTYSPNLRIELIATGEQSGTWGVTTNTNLGTLIEDAISGYVSVSITSANQALTALNGAADQSRNMVINLTTTTGAGFNVYIPPADKLYVIRNSSAHTATIFCSSVLGNTTAAGTGVAVPAGREMLVFSDGTNVSAAVDYAPSLVLGAALPVASGGTGVTTSTGSGNNVLSTSPSLTTPSLSGATVSTSAAVTAGTNAQGQGALTSDFNVVTTAAANPSGVTLPTATTGRTVTVVNRGANPVAIFPATGAAVDGLSANASIILPVNEAATFTASSATQWYSSFLQATAVEALIGVLPVANGGTGITSFGTGVAAALGVNTGSAGAFVVNGGALGTPSSGTVTNLTGTASININGTVGATTPNTGSFTSLTNSGNLTFTGTGNRITGDFSNATVANRVGFQTSTVNGNTNVQAVPNGTGINGGFLGFNNSDPTNAAFIGIATAGGTEARVTSGITGTGTFLPMTFYTSGTEKLRIAADATGTYTFGGTAPRITGDFSNATLANRVMFQTSTVNANTALGVIPNGTATFSGVNVYQSSDPANSAIGDLSISGSGGFVRLRSIATGTGTTLPMIFDVGNSERMRVDTSGNVGIGVTPSAWGFGGNIEIGNGGVFAGAGPVVNYSANAFFDTAWKYKTTAAASYFRQANGAFNFFIAPSGTAGNAITFTQAMTLDASGNLGIGTSSPSKKFVVSDSGCGFEVSPNESGANSIRLISFNRSTSAYVPVGLEGSVLTFLTTPGAGLFERMRIDSSGNVGIGTTSPNGKLAVVGSSSATLGSLAQFTISGGQGFYFNSNSTGTLNTLAVGTSETLAFNTGSSERARISAAGGFSVGTTSDPGAGAINATGNITAYFSDDRLKEKLGKIEGALDKLCSLEGFYYQPNEVAQSLGYEVVREVGISAQKMKEILPEIVAPAPVDPMYMTVRYERALPLIVEAIKELRAEVAALKGAA